MGTRKGKVRENGERENKASGEAHRFPFVLHMIDDGTLIPMILYNGNSSGDNDKDLLQIINLIMKGIDSR